MPSFLDQPLGVGDGVTGAFQLCKYYGSGSEAQQRLITRPVAGSILVGVDGVAVSGWSHLGKGVIAFDEAPAEGTVDRKSVVEGKSVSVSVDSGGRRIIKKKTQKKQIHCNHNIITHT